MRRFGGLASAPSPTRIARQESAPGWRQPNLGMEKREILLGLMLFVDGFALRHSRGFPWALLAAGAEPLRSQIPAGAQLQAEFFFYYFCSRYGLGIPGAQLQGTIEAQAL